MVVFLGDAPNWQDPPSLNFETVKDAVPEQKLYKEKLKTLTAFVVPFGESAQKIGRGGQALETYQVFLIIAREMDVTFTREKLSRLSRELKLAIRRSARMAGCPWMGDETTQKYDERMLREHNNFVSSTRFDFSKIQ